MYRLSPIPFLCLLLLPLHGSPALAALCDAVLWQEYRDTKLLRFPDSTAYFYLVDGMEIDADGAPNAYHPDDKGIDALANAGFPHGAWRSILMVDPHRPDRPFIQPDGEFKGFFVSMTTLQDLSLSVRDIHRYVDATQVPYLVFPGAFFAMKGTGNFGDLGAARQLRTGKESPFIVADKGPRSAPLGEVSVRLAENLGGHNVSPRHGTGAPRGPFVYVVFPKSKSQPPWPVTAEQLQQRVQALLTALGGWDRIISCLPQR
jgi:hypothetical protein